MAPPCPGRCRENGRVPAGAYVALSFDRCFHSGTPKHPGLPSFIPPQLSQLVTTPPEGDAWAHEIKYDGYRIHARLAKGEVKLLTRTGLDWTDRCQTTAKALAGLRLREAYLDGELCVRRLIHVKAPIHHSRYRDLGALVGMDLLI